MLKKIISSISNGKRRKPEVNFFDLPLNEKKEIIKKAAELSAQDQKQLLSEYERKFGDLQTACK